MPSYPHPLTSRLPQVGTTIFSVMSALAQQHGALNLSQGFPDFDAPAELLNLLDQATPAPATTSTRPWRACRCCARPLRPR
jgi:methionine aminotransferase